MRMKGLAKETTNRCPGVDQQGNKFPHDLLDRANLPDDFNFFAQHWLRRANRAREREQWFEGLIYLWVIFNAWLGQVIKDRNMSERDWFLVAAAGRDQLLSAKFEAMMALRPGFRDCVESFHQLWPIFKVRTLEDLKIGGWAARDSTESRSAYRARCFAEDISHRDYAPRCFWDHQSPTALQTGGDPDAVPADWSHTLRAIYQVRCNLFHGGKSFAVSKDKDFARLALELLWDLWGNIHLNRSSWQEDYLTFEFLPEEEKKFKEGTLWQQWHDTYPELFDDDDIRVLESQANKHKFDEWYAAIKIYEKTGYLSLVEKYQHNAHPRKRKFISQFGSQTLEIADKFIRNGFGGSYGPDLLVYAPDHSEWFFCEVKGPRDSFNKNQLANFPELADLLQKPIRIVRLSEKR